MMRKYRVKVPEPMASFEFEAMSNEQAIAFFGECTVSCRTAALFDKEGKRLAQREFYLLEAF
jgi:hypothetical protein